MREMLFRIEIALLAWMLGSGSAAAGNSLGERIDQFVEAEMQRQQIPGVAVGVVWHGAIVKAQGYGYANLEHQVPVSAQTIFQSGSLGKQFTSALVMLLVEDGKLALSDPLTKFFPQAPASWHAITLRHLLTHTSGIPDYEDGKLDLRRDYSEEDLTRFAMGLALEFAPGERWQYSNTGYVLLGIIVHTVSGAFYGDLLTDKVFKPLGMSTARIISEADIVPNRAAGYRLVDGAIKNQEWVSPVLNTTADGSLYLTVRDMIAWEAGLHARALLKPASWRQILTPVQLNNGEHYPYGFGWFLDERGGQPLERHSGSWQGFTGEFSRFVGEELSVIVFANLEQAQPDRIANGIAAIINAQLSLPAATGY